MRKNNKSIKLNIIKSYISTLTDIYDELLEIDLSQNKYFTISCNKNKYLITQRNGNLSLLYTKVIKKEVYIDDQERVAKFFSRESLLEKYNTGKDDFFIEFRRIRKDGSYQWVKAILEAVKKSSHKKFLCFMRDIEDQKKMEEEKNRLLEKNKFIIKDFIDSLKDLYEDIIQVDLNEKSLLVIKSETYPRFTGKTFPYERSLKLFCNKEINYQHRSLFLEKLSILNLKNLADKKTSETIEIQSLKKYCYQWLNLSILSIPNIEVNCNKVLITSKNINEVKMTKDIVKLFIYDSCDYFVFINAKNDTYEMFSSNPNSPIPPFKTSCYSQEVIKYNKEFVVAEEVEEVTNNMMLENVVKHLEENNEYITYAGVMDPVRGYTHKQLKFKYSDKINQTILLIRTDVTDVYNNEKKKNDELRKALIEARTDALTGLYNHKYIFNLISDWIITAENKKGAFLFIDIDNFKKINDNLGHQKGDFLLKTISKEICNKLKSSDIIGRIGGDEFVVFLKDVQYEDEVKLCAASICNIFNNIEDPEIKKIGPSCSIGIALYPKDGNNYDTLCSHADKMLYKAKENGKNQFL